MTPTQVDQIVAEVREAARRRARASEPADPSSLALEGELARDLSSLFTHQEIAAVELGSHRRLTGALVAFVKRLLRRLLTPFLERQSAYNQSNARVVEHLVEELREAKRRQALLEERLEALESPGPGRTTAEEAEATEAPADERRPPPGLSRARRRAP